MADLEDLTRLPDDFDGQVRLFPLPSLVLFPHAMQPLHIFEPRYCEMLAEALESDELIAMATLAGTPSKTKGDPPIAKTVCVGRIVSHVERDDEKHNILLVGIKRARVTAEIDAGRCFRIAKIDVLEDLYPPSGLPGRGKLRGELLAAFGKVIPATESVQQGLSELLAGSMGLGPITDIISHTLPLSVSLKLQLLGEADVDQRAKRLISFLASGLVKLEEFDPGTSEPKTDTAGRPMPFPPPFSLN
jgi:ATP-dependent Lon protease